MNSLDANVSIVQLLRNGQNDLSWFSDNSDKFKNEYDGKFVAFHNKQIIDTDANFDSLLNKLRKDNVDTSSVFIKFISKVKMLL